MDATRQVYKRLNSHFHLRVENLYYYSRICHYRQILYDSRLDFKTRNSYVARNYSRRKMTTTDKCILAMISALIFRYMLTCIMMTTGRGELFFSVDIVMEAVAQRQKLDARSFMLLSILFTYVLSTHYFRNYRCDWIVVDRLYQAVVKNCDQFWYEHRNLPRPDYNSTSVLRNMVRFYRTLRATNKFIVQHTNSPKTFERLSFDFRWDRGAVQLPELLQAKLVTRLMVLELINGVLVLMIRILIIASIIGYVKFVRKNRPEFGPFLYFLVGLDRYVTMTLACLAIPHSFYFIFSMKLTAWIFTHKLVKLNNSVEKLVNLGKSERAKGNMARFRQQILLPRVMQICFEHNQIATHLCHMNKKMISIDVMVFGVSNMPFNVYLVTRLLLGYSAQVMIFAVLIIQLYMVVICSLPMMRINRTIVIWTRHLPNLIAFLFSTNLNSLITCVKLKTQTFFETFNAGQHWFGFTIGPLGLVTRNVIVRFFIMYWAYTIFACGLIRKNMAMEEAAA